MDQGRWESVLARSAGEVEFVYAVTTTGIFCRPTCPARRPRREHVAFFDDAHQARNAGYRPCRRCRPDETDDVEFRRVVEASRAQLLAGGTLRVTEMAQRAATSPRQLNRAFRRHLGTSPSDFGTAVRVQRAREILRASSRVTTAIYDTGFASSRAFYETVAPTLGMKPRDFVRGAPDEEIVFTVTATSLGPAVIAASTRGICAVHLCVSEDDAPTMLADQFPRARLRRAEGELTGAIEAVRDLARGVESGRDLPLDVRGTAFQARVWAALRQIPTGETRTYGEIASAVGSPRAARAVGSACATNTLALLIPCHRAVRGDGSRGDYRWGAGLKSDLLAHEARTRDIAQSTSE